MSNAAILRARPSQAPPEPVRITIWVYALGVAQAIFNCRQFLAFWLKGYSVRMMMAPMFPLTNDIQIALMIAITIGLWLGHRWAWWLALLFDGYDTYYALVLVFATFFGRYPSLANVLSTGTSVAGFVLLLWPSVRRYYSKQPAAAPRPRAWRIDPVARHVIALVMLASPLLLFILTNMYFVLFVLSPFGAYVAWGAVNGFMLRYGNLGPRLAALGWHLGFVVYRELRPLYYTEPGGNFFALLGMYAAAATVYLAITAVLQVRRADFGQA